MNIGDKLYIILGTTGTNLMSISSVVTCTVSNNNVPC